MIRLSVILLAIWAIWTDWDISRLRGQVQALERKVDSLEDGIGLLDPREPTGTLIKQPSGELIPEYKPAKLTHRVPDDVPVRASTVQVPGKRITFVEGDTVTYKGLKYPIETGPRGGRFFMAPNQRGEMTRHSLPKPN